MFNMNPGHTKKEKMGVIFDWSGVLANELDILAEVHTETLSSLGGSRISADEWNRRVSRDWSDIYLSQGVTPTRVKKAPQIFIRNYQERINKVTPCPGASDVLRELRRQGIKVAILSNQFGECIKSVIQKFGWADQVDMIVAADDTYIPKEDVRSVWRILRELELEPENTIMVDDMPEGIDLALSVGIYTIGKRSKLQRDLSNSDVQIDELTEIMPIILAQEKERKKGKGFASAAYASVYEKRERSKLEGSLKRIPQFYHAENSAFVDFLFESHVPSSLNTVVDVGCGGSFHTSRMQEKYNIRAVRVDISRTALLRGQQNREIASLQGDAAQIPLRDEIGDLTLCLEILEHVISPERVAQELYRIARSDGLVVVATPNSMERTWPPYRSLQRKSFDAGHIREFTGASLVKLMEDSGFKVEFLGSRWFFMYWIFFSIERGPLVSIFSRVTNIPLVSRKLQKLIRKLTLREVKRKSSTSDRGIGVFVIARKPKKD